MDNVIFVASFCPVIEQLALNVKDLPLWWALLFGACFGGNITMIGSTANIVALGMLEKHSGKHMTFFRWLKIGILSTALSGAMAVCGILLLERFMPDRHSHLGFDQIEQITAAGRHFDDKNVEIVSLVTAAPDGAEKGEFLKYVLSSPDRELQQQLGTRIEAQIPAALIAKLGKDAPDRNRPERKYVVRGALTSLEGGVLLMEVSGIVKMPGAKKK